MAISVLNWIDGYVHPALSVGPVRRTRFHPHAFDSLNAYSLRPDCVESSNNSDSATQSRNDTSLSLRTSE